MQTEVVLELAFLARRQASFIRHKMFELLFGGFSGFSLSFSVDAGIWLQSKDIELLNAVRWWWIGHNTQPKTEYRS